MKVHTIAVLFVMMIGGAVAISAGARSMILNVEAAVPGPEAAKPPNQSASPKPQTATPSGQTAAPTPQTASPAGQTATPPAKTASPAPQSATPSAKTVSPIPQVPEPDKPCDPLTANPAGSQAGSGTVRTQTPRGGASGATASSATANSGRAPANSGVP
jgi:hypothetical protein